MLFRLSSVATLLVTLALALPIAAPSAQSPTVPLRLSLVPYAAYFSLQTKAADLVDPGMFVAVPGAPPATSLLQLAHAPGIRNAKMSDDGSQAAFDANGRRLTFTLQRWFAPASVIELSPENVTGQVPIDAHFANLVPGGRYTLFVVHLTAKPVTYSPLDGTVTAAEWFTAASDGSADSEFTVPGPLNRTSILELVYHSDSSEVERGLLRSDLGINAHVQAVARIP
jgi:hypothetical protein